MDGYGLALADVILFFFICAFLGWCLECVYKTIVSKKFVNSGMLRGPLCPIYGFGGVFAVFFNDVLFSNSMYSGVTLVIIQFIVFALVMTIIEYVGGKVLLERKGLRLWDYSKEWLHYETLVCPKFSFYWGLASLVMIYGIQPRVVMLLTALTPASKVLYAVLLTSYLLYSLAQVTTNSSNRRFR